MSSVEVNGVWYKRCHRCLTWVDYEDLRYEEPGPETPYGLDICPECEADPEGAKARRVMNQAEINRYRTAMEEVTR